MAENQRVRLSKALLQNALVDLLQQKPLAQISVLEVCEAASINRTTFYKHYKSTDDLLDDVLDAFIEKGSASLMAQLKADEDALPSMLAYLYENRRTFCTLVAAMPTHELANRLFEAEGIREIYRTIFSDGYSELESRYLQTFVFHGVFAIIGEWLMSEKPEEVDEMARVIGTLRGMFN